MSTVPLPLVLSDLRKSFGTIQAVAGLDLEVVPGEILGLLGPNGAGKTTTMAIVSGVLQPDGGRALVYGRPAREPEARTRLGIAPQNLAVYPDLSAEENLRFFGRLYGLRGSRLRERAEVALGFAGLLERRRDRSRDFSGGMQRRLNLACALVHDPELVLLDEPTAGVDPQSRNHLFEVLQTLRDAGKTIVYSTHYMEEAERLCDRAAIIDHGRVLALDTIAGLIAAHGGDPWLEAQLAEPPPPGVELPELDAQLGWRTRAADPLAEVTRVQALGVRLRSFAVRSPDLESVFLSLTGRTLRD